MKKLILSILSFFVIASVPIVTYAIEVRITTNVDTTPATFPLFEVEGGFGGKPAVLLAPCAVPPCTATYGSFTIKDQSATSRARVFLNDQPTYKTLTLTNAIITNTSALDTPVKTIEIEYVHTFTPDVSAGVDQFYSLAMSGFFKRGTGTTLATGSNITLTGFGGFDTCFEGCLIEQQLIGANNLEFLSHTVGTTNSFVDPLPELKDNFSCNSLEGCSVEGTVLSFLRINASINLKGQHSLTVSSSLTGGCTCNDVGTQEDTDTAQSLLNLPVDIQPETNPNSINLKKRGVVPLAILGSGDYDPTDPTTGIDPLTVDFMGAMESHGRGHIEDVNSDGHLDLVLHFSVPDTYLECGDTLGTVIGETFDGKPIEGSDSINVKCK